MRVAARAALLAVFAKSALGIRILMGNDDGWAELYLRSFYDNLVAVGHDVVVSAPADNQSGTGSLEEHPLPRIQACQYDSCPPDSGPTGHNATDPRLNWVNSFPATAIQYGLFRTGPDNFWNGNLPELVVTGPNVGSNTFLAVPFSGTVGAAVYAAKRGVPAIAFSGESGGNLPWNVDPGDVPARSLHYAAVATKLVQTLVGAGPPPYLPTDAWLNVNFPSTDDPCSNPETWKWVLTRINPGFLSPLDMEHCGTQRLPTEDSVLKADGCYISVSVGDAKDKTTIDANRQAVVAERLKELLTCFP